MADNDRALDAASDRDVAFMREALALARRAAAEGEVPVGAVLVRDGTVIGAGWNRPIVSHDPTAHAEVCALRDAAERVGNYRLPGTTLYVTLEPCPMCAGAIVNARVKRLVFGCTNPKAGAVETLYTIVTDPRLNHRVEVRGGVLATECAAELSQFFAALRRGPSYQG